MYCTDGYSCKIHKTDDHEKCPKSRLDSTFQLLHEFNQTLFGGVHMRQIPLAPRSCWWKMNQMVSTEWTDGRGHAFTTLMIWQRVAVSPWSHEGSSDDRQKMLTVGNSQNTKLFGTQIDRVHFFAARLWLGPWAVVLGIIPLKTRLFDFLSHHPSFAKSFSHAGFAADFKLAPAIWAEISRTMACGATHRKQRISVFCRCRRENDAEDGAPTKVRTVSGS